jgi:hypothetical protein
MQQPPGGYGPPPGPGYGPPPGAPGGYGPPPGAPPGGGYGAPPGGPPGYGPPPGPPGYGPPGYGPPPGYGGPPPKKGLSVWAYLGIGALVLFGGCVAVCAVGVNQAGKEAKKEKEAFDDAKSMKVTADELTEAYEKNEVSADEKYKGKKIEITGVIERIDSGFNDEPQIVLKAKNFIGVRCEGLSKKDAGKLEKGSEITLVCKGDGEIIGSPQLKDCKQK